MEGNKVACNFKLDLLCRVCLAKGEDMQPLFEEDSIIQQIEYCTGLHLYPEPNFPSHICRTCLAHLDTAHTFKTTCLASDLSLHSSQPHIDTFPEAFPQAPESPHAVVKEEIEDTDSDGFDNVSDWGDDIQKSKKVKMKKEPEDSPPDIKPRVYKKRGPYKKKNPRPPRLRKYKFRRLFCATCDLKFTSKKELDAHNADAHPDKVPERWICEICGKSFVHRGSHYSHVRAHEPPAHGCPRCDYRTPHRSDLAKHLQIHMGDKKYQCTKCPRSFYTSSNLTSHVRRLHERLRPHGCPQCPKRFFDTTKLRRHLDSHTDIKRYECELCHSAYTRRCYWKKHMLAQHGVAVPSPKRPGRQRALYTLDNKQTETRTDTQRED